MTPEQKQRIGDAVNDWTSDPGCKYYGDQMAAMLQELVDAPEPSSLFTLRVAPPRRLEIRYTGDLTEDIPAGEYPLYFAPPAPSVPNIEPSKEQLTQLINGLGHCFIEGSAREFLRVWIRDWTAHKLNMVEPPADVARDAERYRWLRKKNAELGRGFYVGDDTDKEPGDITWIGSDLDAAIDAAIERQGGE